jgi:hypothetical protein
LPEAAKAVGQTGIISQDLRRDATSTASALLVRPIDGEWKIAASAVSISIGIAWAIAPMRAI